MYSVLSELYHRRYRPDDMDDATARACEDMFSIGFCMGARIMIEVLTSIEFS